MLTITETPHRGPARTWYATDEIDFCNKVSAANPHCGEIPDFRTFGDFVAYLRDDLRDLTITED